MFRVKKTMEVSASHKLHFSASDSWEPLHGHNWKITIYCQSEELDEDGFVVNFLDIEAAIHDVLDHTDLGDVLDCNPSTENLARWICEHVDKCYRVDVVECSGNEASYEV